MKYLKKIVTLEWGIKNVKTIIMTKKDIKFNTFWNNCFTLNGSLGMLQSTILLVLIKL